MRHRPVSFDISGKRFWPFMFAPVLAFAVAGCGSSDIGAARRLMGQASRATRIARAYDRGIGAFSKRDDAAFLTACHALSDLDAGEQIITLARGASDEASSYWDANTLNAAGYSLAELGTTQSEFAAAEIMTRRATELCDFFIASPETKSPSDAMVFRYTRAQTRDSLAWALFRQHRLEDALREQQNAVAESKATAALSGPEGQATLLFHLGEILRALGRNDQARTQFQAALKADPTDAQSRQSLRALNTNAR